MSDDIPYSTLDEVKNETTKYYKVKFFNSKKPYVYSSQIARKGDYFLTFNRFGFSVVKVLGRIDPATIKYPLDKIVELKWKLPDISEEWDRLENKQDG